MRYVVVAACTLAGLVGCVSEEQREAQYAAQDEARCTSWGITRSDPRYAQCRALLSQQGAAGERAADIAAQQNYQALGANGAALMQAGRTVPVASPVRLQTNCIRQGAFLTCY